MACSWLLPSDGTSEMAGGGSEGVCSYPQSIGAVAVVYRYLSQLLQPQEHPSPLSVGLRNRSSSGCSVTRMWARTVHLPAWSLQSSLHSELRIGQWQQCPAPLLDTATLQACHGKAGQQDVSAVPVLAHVASGDHEEKGDTQSCESIC